MIILFGQPLLVDQCLLMPKNTLLVTIKALMDSDTYKYVLCDQAGSVGLPLMISKEVTEERIVCLYVSWRVIVVKWFANVSTITAMEVELCLFQTSNYGIIRCYTKIAKP